MAKGSSQSDIVRSYKKAWAKKPYKTAFYHVLAIAVAFPLLFGAAFIPLAIQILIFGVPGAFLSVSLNKAGFFLNNMGFFEAIGKGFTAIKDFCKWAGLKVFEAGKSVFTPSDKEQNQEVPDPTQQPEEEKVEAQERDSNALPQPKRTRPSERDVKIEDVTEQEETKAASTQNAPQDAGASIPKVQKPKSFKSEIEERAASMTERIKNREASASKSKENGKSTGKS